MHPVESKSLEGLVACAAGTVSYLPRARVAAESWRRHHPDSPFVVLLIDGQDWPRETEAFEIVLPEELGLAPDELAVRLAIYDAYEMAIALKAQMFRVLLDRGASAVLFTDTDTCFYSPVDDIGDVARASGNVLFPHSTRPALVRKYFPTGQIEYRRLTNGLFNTGLQAIGANGRAFLDWWDNWLARDCLRAPEAGIWADQIWADWALVYFEPVILRDSSVNVAFWNLDERQLGEMDGNPAVDGSPLRHFHFAGFDPRRPELLSTYLEDAPLLPPLNPVLTELLSVYAKRLAESGSEELRERPYGFGMSAGGRPLGQRERSIYREAVLAAEFRDRDSPPNPFDSSRVEEFERLLDDPDSLRSLSPQARKRIERVRQPGVTLSSFSRMGKRLLPALRYGLAETPPSSPEVHGRVASDAVQQEY
jgi:hypothetical protein